jgi:hypothetical protein
MSPNVLSLSTLDNNTTTFSLSLQDTVVVSLFLCRSTTSFVSIPNNHSLLATNINLVQKLGIEPRLLATPALLVVVIVIITNHC